MIVPLRKKYSPTVSVPRTLCHKLGSRKSMGRNFSSKKFLQVWGSVLAIPPWQKTQRVVNEETITRQNRKKFQADLNKTRR
jgi:hypothetical protein